MSSIFFSKVEPPKTQHRPAYWFIFREDHLLTRTEPDGEVSIPYIFTIDDIDLTPLRRLYLGNLAGTDCYTADLAADTVLPDWMQPRGLRSLYGQIDDELFAMAGRAVQILTWDSTHQFCGRCATPTVPELTERSRTCPNCGLHAYPRVSPAVIVLVTRGEEVLLARGKNFPAAFYSTPAGFVEPGETLEETVERELFEELEIQVSDIRYFGSQPWPFPHQLMVGFTCTWEYGEIVVDPEELADARWFTRDTMPLIPPHGSISRRLIDSYLGIQEEDKTSRP